ncbi:hypothetical protein GCM10011414_10120 [Croceivirga lutea]|uniref:GT-D fold domain-containing protein n=1 Tax=Croceivirga lutea TaxID=1775167 RepID=UPI00163B2731|nr:hypothetical protein [Croceivirga lutea]GGG42524.1 hypothetical protein GCM10011414_10120 [Croceivirga lutea]
MMNSNTIYNLSLLARKIFQFIKLDLNKKPNFSSEGQNASNEIKAKILSNEPVLIARLGATEFKCISGYINQKRGVRKYADFILNKTDTLKIDNSVIEQAKLWSGIFPGNTNTINKFVEKSIEDLKEVDILGIWLKENYLLRQNIEKKYQIPLKDIEPYYHQNPWSKALENKKVLIIHPFTETIKNQYLKRSLLFKNQDVLPNFDLKVIKSVQSIAGQAVGFKDWFSALDHMKNQMDNTDYDIAIIGCGAYGMSLGAHAKRKGKQAIHLGGATQIMFGIKGSRWDNHPTISKFYNNEWVRPSESEAPRNKEVVEEACYW